MEQEKLWYKETVEETLSAFETTKSGLTNDEINKRLKEYGKNILPKGKRKNVLFIFFEQLKDPIKYILIITIILSLIIGETIDAIFITIVILLDAFIGTYQEWKASRSAESLQNLIKVIAKVVRDDNEVEIDSENLVVGDIVDMEPGAKISADLRIIDCYNLAIDESVLTGESFASVKVSEPFLEDIGISDRENMAYAGSSVISGRGHGVVTATGTNTEIGKIASTVLLSEDTKTPLVIRMEKFTKQIGVVTAIVAVLIALILYYKGIAGKDIFFIVVALSVSAIPEGLPFALTLSLSIASNRMAKKNVIVKKLNSVESLGSCTVIASDKTGTLTLNEQTAKIVLLPDDTTFKVEGVGYNDAGQVLATSDGSDVLGAKKLAELGLLNNEAKLEKENGIWINHGDSIDVAFLSLAYKLKVDENLKDNIVGEIPYESENKYSAVFYKENEDIYCTVKGSVEKVMSFCKTMDINNKSVSINESKIKEQNEKLASMGYRVIALAKGIKNDFVEAEGYEDKDIPDLTLVGLVGFIDPIRKEAVASLEHCRNAGIKVVMITGDHPLTAFAISKELGIASNYDEVTTGNDIDAYFKKGYAEFDIFIKEKKVFTRVTPLQKLEIIESYKRMGEFVAVTGDGVNDAPAMKAANIGIAVGSGTDVAKETGSMIITDDNFLSIVSGIEEGRIAYSNVRKVIYMLLSCGIGEVLFVVLSILFNLPIPLVAVQLLWLNLVTDGIQDIALSFESAEEGIMDEPPRSPKEKIFDKRLKEETLIAASVIGIVVWIVWYYLIKHLNLEITLARSYILLLMVFIQNVHVFNCRSEKTSIFKIHFKSNPFIYIGIGATLILHLIVTETALSKFLKVVPIPVEHIKYIFLMSLPILFVMEIYKKIRKEKDSN
ncbi:MAG: HAD-IC family P-type ATPase [Bacilli bacterium]|nr:HAD-IC family P-type ATPase [Bacilli bacterium]MDD4282829.1 HAD-IC family P-type ATPase [Bacilli bacterium]MDD4719117.1 HAD-IC family P-type ATPase [Bacilli bacterium]